MELKKDDIATDHRA